MTYDETLRNRLLALRAQAEKIRLDIVEAQQGLEASCSHELVAVYDQHGDYEAVCVICGKGTNKRYEAPTTFGAFKGRRIMDLKHGEARKYRGLVPLGIGLVVKE